MDVKIKQRYFDGKVSHGFVALFSGKTIVTVAMGLLGLFMPIFWFNIFGQSFKYVVIYYMINFGGSRPAN